MSNFILSQYNDGQVVLIDNDAPASEMRIACFYPPFAREKAEWFRQNYARLNAFSNEALNIGDVVGINNNAGVHVGHVGKIIEVNNDLPLPYFVRFAGGESVYYLRQHLRKV